MTAPPSTHQLLVNPFTNPPGVLVNFAQHLVAVRVGAGGVRDDAAVDEPPVLAGLPVPDEALSLIADFRLIRWMATIGWFHQRPEVNRPSAIFEERKAWVLEQCRALQRSQL